eukprot:2174348-Alexandrium_andersonii.AAC.1
MSASLVGSEMCIRDRTRDEFRLALQNFVESLRAADWAHPGNVTHGFGPVSYTHLTLPTICSV